GVEAAGIIDWLAHAIAWLAGGSLSLATVLMVWVSGLVSGTVDNIPYTIAVLPIADSLTAGIDAAKGSQVLYWALILGADLGGNATYIGSAANIVAVGLLAQAGYHVSFGRFLRDGLLITGLTLLAATFWLLVKY